MKPIPLSDLPKKYHESVSYQLGHADYHPHTDVTTPWLPHPLPEPDALLLPLGSDTDEGGGATMRKWNPWTRKEDESLCEMIGRGGLTLIQMGERLQRTKAAVACRANFLGATSGRTGKNLDSVPRRGMMDVGLCLNCGKEFLSLIKHKRKYCSRACSSARLGEALGQASARRFIKTPDGICPTCGKSFNRQNRPKKVYCSHSCSTGSVDVQKKMRASLEKNPLAKKTAYKSNRGGWIVTGGKRIYTRSGWEANYARYLQWQKERGEIIDWEHEPKTFWFEGIKRGCLSYLPDFRVVLRSGEEYHEVKGWMDDRSVTKIDRMAKYHPTVKLVVIDSTRYRALAKTLKNIIPGWQT